jgi:methylmalonyl-CoA mutase
MQRLPDPDQNIGPFPYLSKKEWVTAARQEMDGAEPTQKLVQRVDGLEILPFYDASDLPSFHFPLPVSQNEFLGPRTWYNLQRITANDSLLANTVALQALNEGADGVLLDVHADSRPEILLKGIELPYCCTSFWVDAQNDTFFPGFAGLAKERKYKVSEVSGAIFWKSPPKSAVEHMQLFRDWDQFHSLGIASEGNGSPSTEIADLLASAVYLLDQLPDQKGLILPALRSIAFSLPIGSDFFLEIIKLKVLRQLWWQLAKAYHPDYHSHLFVHARIDPWNNPAYEPRENMIHSTTAAMSAVLGGSDAITLEAADPGDGLALRIARNVSSLLREESHLGKVSDPVAGSYYVESLTDQLASETWNKFRERTR